MLPQEVFDFLRLTKALYSAVKKRDRLVKSDGKM